MIVLAISERAYEKWLPNLVQYTPRFEHLAKMVVCIIIRLLSDRTIPISNTKESVVLTNSLVHARTLFL